MIPIIFPADETQFKTNGLFRLTDCISCEVTEERNGIYEVEFTYPTTGAHYEDIEEGQIIYTTHDESGEPEPFDIYKRSVPIDGIVTFNACHISYRLRNVILQPFEAASCAATFAAIPNNVINNCPFTFTTNKEVTAAYKLTVPKNVREMLGGTQGSILDVYGTGEYEFKKFAVKLWLHRGKDTDVSIRYGKNLISMTDETDAGDVYNAVVPYWQGMDGDLVTVPGYIVTASDFQPGDVPVPVTLDLSMEFEEAPTTQELASMAQSKIDADDVRKGTRSIKVDFVQLWQTEEYKDIKPLERLKLCDTVTVVYGDVSTRQKINRVVYDSLLEKYKEMELGASVQSLADALTSSMKKALTEMMEETDKEISWAVQHATDLITGVNGGYVILRRNNDGQPIELLICDTPDYLTATKVWRWNQNGLGYSSTGYQGPYGTAITNDGHIVGNYVDTGIIKGLLSDSYWNLDTGDFYSVYPQTAQYRRIAMTAGNMHFYSSTGSAFGDRVASFKNVRIDVLNAGVTAALSMMASSGSVLLAYEDGTSGNTYYAGGVLGKDVMDEIIYIPPDPDTPTEPEFPRAFIGRHAVVGGVLFYNGLAQQPKCLGRITPQSTNLVFRQLHHYLIATDYNDNLAFAINSRAGSERKAYGIDAPLVLGTNAAISNQVQVYKVSGNAETGTATRLGAFAARNNTTINADEMRLLLYDYWTVFTLAYTQASEIKVGYRMNPSQYTIGGHSEKHLFYGTVYCDSNMYASAFVNLSDARKKDVLEWDDDLDKLIDRLHVVRYEWKEDDGLDHVGLIAQEVEEEMKKLGISDMFVHTSEGGEKSLNYSEINTLLIRKVQTQQKQINDLEARLERLEKRLEG